MSILGCTIDAGGNLASEIALDLDALIGTHACVVANSGGGKSGLVRRILETTHGRVQHIILDPEDEFYTLRERFDYVIAGGDGGDVPATVEGAAGLALAALTHGFSLIVQLNDLDETDPDDPSRNPRAEFVANFLSAMIRAPRELWHPCLVVVDEVQLFAPSEGRTPASAAVRQLTSRGRKRGFTAILASQRISKINADVRGDINNWLLGRTGQTLDRNIMADQLGFTPAEGRTKLRVEARSFWAFGPAIAPEPVAFRVADVETTLVKSGQAKVPTPPAPEALRGILAGLAVPADLPEKNASGFPEDAARVKLATEVSDLRGQLAAMERDRDAQRERADGFDRRILNAVRALGYVNINADEPEPVTIEQTRANLPIITKSEAPAPAKPTRAVVAPSAGASGAPSSLGDLPTGARKLIEALAKHYPRALPIEHVAKIAGVSMKSSQWLANFRAFEASGFVKPFIVAGQWELTTRGRDSFNLAGKPDDPAALLEFWMRAFPPSTANMLRVLVEERDWMNREEIADRAGVSRTSSALGSGLKELRDHGLAEQIGNGVHRATEVML